MMIFLKRYLILLIIIFLKGNIFSEELTFGSQIKKFEINNIKKETISFPADGCVTILYFFDTDNSSHIRVLSRIDFLLINLKDTYDHVKFLGISVSQDEKLTELQKIYGGRINFINDKEKRLFDAFNYSCGSCIQILLIDRRGKLRYITSSFDPWFLREIIMRYTDEN